MKLPIHITFELLHNPHAVLHVSAAEYEQQSLLKDAWLDEDHRARALATNDFWECRWYPSNSVGFCLMASADLPSIIAALEAAP